MPAVFSELPLEKLCEQRQLNMVSSKVTPIAIHYPGGLFPLGIFSSLVSHLQTKSNWKISTRRGKPACLFKNCIKFSVDGCVTASVTLIYFHNWIELHANIFNKDKQKACLLSLRDTLIDGLKCVQKVQIYSSLVPELAFLCQCKCENPSFLHLASLVDPGNEFMRCTQDETLCTELTARHKLWLGSIDGMYIP